MKRKLTTLTDALRAYDDLLPPAEQEGDRDASVQVSRFPSRSPVRSVEERRVEECDSVLAVRHVHPRETF